MKTITWLSPQDAPEWFPPTEQALEEPQGLLAAGGDLSPQRLLGVVEMSSGTFAYSGKRQPAGDSGVDPAVFHRR